MEETNQEQSFQEGTDTTLNEGAAEVESTELEDDAIEQDPSEEHGEESNEATHSEEETSDDADQEVEISDEERQSGYLRDKDYRQKTQAVADERRAFEEERQKFQDQQRELQEKQLADLQERTRVAGMNDSEREEHETQKQVDAIIDKRVDAKTKEIRESLEKDFEPFKAQLEDQLVLKQEQMIASQYNLSAQESQDVTRYAAENKLSSLEHAYKIMHFDSQKVIQRKKGAQSAAKQIKKRKAQISDDNVQAAPKEEEYTGNWLDQRAEDLKNNE